MGELTVAQIVLLVSLQNSGLKVEEGNFSEKYNSFIAEKVVNILADQSDRPALRILLPKDPSMLTASEKLFLDQIVKKTIDKMNIGKGEWD